MPTTTPDPRHPTERVYDEQIAPLVAQIIDIAKEHGIPFFCTAGMIMRDGSAGGCTTKVGTPTDARLHGVVNQHGWCQTIARNGRWQTAARAMVTSYHDAPPDPAVQS
jgi:hypothetical protein